MIKVFTSVVTFLVFACVKLGYAAENWPQFLGPDGNGHSKAVDLPLQWSEEKQHCLENANSRSWLVVPGHLGQSNLADHGNVRWPPTLRALHRP